MESRGARGAGTHHCQASGKDRASRYQSAAELRADLVGQVGHAVSPAKYRRSIRGLRYAFATGVVLTTIGLGVFFWHRSQAKPLTDKDILVLADFTNNTVEPVFDATLREAVAIRLEESPFLKVMSDEEIRQELRLMGRPPDQHISNDIARELCIREADKAMVSASITRLGTAYAITLRATNCQSGEVLARGQVQAENKEHVLPAIRAVGGEIRAKLGESLSSIQQLDRPFEQVTTPSLEAFQAFTDGEEELAQGSFPPAMRSFQRAIELDPNFALAYASIGIAYNNVGEYEIRDEYWRKAFSLIGLVNSERERLVISSQYYLVTGQTDKIADTAQIYARTYPRDEGPHNVLGNIYFDNGELDKALAEFQEVVRLEPKPDGGNYANVISTDTSLEQLEEAKAVARKAFAQKLDDPMIHDRLLVLAYTEGDRDAAAKEVQWFTGKPEESQSLRRQAENAYALGQPRRAKELYRRAKELFQRRDLGSAAARVVVDDAISDALLGNCETVRSTAETAALPYQNRDFSQPATLGLALCGQAAQAQRIAERISKQFPVDTLWNTVKMPSIQAASELKRNHAAKAIELLQSAAPYERRYPSVMYLRGLAYLEAHDGPKSAGEFQKVLDHKGAYWMNQSRGPYFPLSYLGLARAAAMSGDTAKSNKAYQNFLTLWKDADPDLVPLIQARKEYAALP